jgi:methylglutaconyl-CoA hydratase
MATIMSPRLMRLAAPIAVRPIVSSTRVFISRYSTAADEDVIKTSQVPAPGSGHVRVLQLNRPQARNAISRHLLDTLSKQVNAIAEEGGNGPTRALVVASSADAAFCAGADLKERAGMTMAEYEVRLRAGIISATCIANS